jgi:hypothetical protein
MYQGLFCVPIFLEYRHFKPWNVGISRLEIPTFQINPSHPRGGAVWLHRLIKFSFAYKTYISFLIYEVERNKTAVILWDNSIYGLCSILLLFLFYTDFEHDIILNLSVAENPKDLLVYHYPVPNFLYHQY